MSCDSGRRKGREGKGGEGKPQTWKIKHDAVGTDFSNHVIGIIYHMAAV